MKGPTIPAHLIPGRVYVARLLYLFIPLLLHPCPSHPTTAPPLQSQLLSLCDNSVLYLWSLEEMVPEVVHKIAFGLDSSYNK